MYVIVRELKCSFYMSFLISENIYSQNKFFGINHFYFGFGFEYNIFFLKPKKSFINS